MVDRHEDPEVYVQQHFVRNGEFDHRVSCSKPQVGGENQAIRDSELDPIRGGDERIIPEGQSTTVASRVSTPRAKRVKLASSEGANINNFGSEGVSVEVETRRSQRCTKPSVKMKDFVLYR